MSADRRQVYLQGLNGKNTQPDGMTEIAIMAPV
jgi:hypothetical protein